MLGLTGKQTHDVEFFMTMHYYAYYCIMPKIQYYSAEFGAFNWNNDYFYFPIQEMNSTDTYVCEIHFLECLGTVVPKLCKSVKNYTKMKSTKRDCWLNLPKVQPVTILKVSLPWHLPSFNHLTGGKKPGISPPRISFSLSVARLVQTICGNHKVIVTLRGRGSS